MVLGRVLLLLEMLLVIGWVLLIVLLLQVALVLDLREPHCLQQQLVMRKKRCTGRVCEDLVS